MSWWIRAGIGDCRGDVPSLLEEHEVAPLVSDMKETDTCRPVVWATDASFPG
jgi:hypothetical protein